MKKHALVLACLTLCWLPARAQVSSSITGTVTDATGGVVPGAGVTAKSLETGATLSTTTDSQGHYSFLSLPVGAQEVRAAKERFKTAVRSGVHLEVGQQARIDLRLEVGETSQQVTVTEEAPVVNTTTSSVAGIVDERQVKDLPLNGRSFDNLITLNPGSLNYVLKSPQTTTSNGNTFAVSGREPSENVVMLNGIEYTGTSQLAVTPGGVSGQLLGIDAVREFNVVTNAYSAEYGKRAGAQVSVVTQSGTASLRGSVFEYLRNSAFDARNGIADRGAVPLFHRNQFGASLGGPLKKTKLFLFANYEGFRQSLAVSSVAIVPDAQARIGNLPNSAGVYTTVAGLNALMLPFMALWPDPNGPELPVNGLPSGTALSYNNPKQSVHENFGTTRADYLLSSRNTLSGIYTIDDGTSIVPLANPLFGSLTNLRSQVASVQDVHVFSPNMLNTFTEGFSRAAWALGADNYSSFPAGLSFVTGRPPGSTAISGITSAGPLAAGVRNERNLFTSTDTLQYSRGRHQLSFGVWVQRLQDNEDGNSSRLGGASFTSLTTFLQSTAASFTVAPNPTPLGWRSLLSAWFVQDSFKLRPNFTLQFGYRQEATTGWNEVAGRAANFVTDANGVFLTNPALGDSIFSKNNAKHLAGPRAGLAWDVFGNGHTAIRAGYGLYHSLMDALAFNLDLLPPYNGTASFNNVSLPSILPITAGVQPFPVCGPGVLTPCTTYAPRGVQSDAKTPAVEEWNFTLEQRLSSSTVLRLGYAGSFGDHGLVSVDPNAIAGQVCQSAAGCTAGGTPGTTKSAAPKGTYYIPVTSRPNPYMSAAFMWYAEGNSSYDALQADVSRRMTRGFQVRGNFTWSKSLDMNSAPTGAQASNQAQMIMDRNNLHRDWGPSALNAARQASISAIYELPFGKGKMWLGNSGRVADAFLGGWQFSEITTLVSGFPITPLVGSNRSGDGDTRNPDRPNPNPGFSGPIVTGNPNQWFNPAAFLLPAPGTYGSAGRGILTGPGLANADASLLKSFPVTEHIHCQFRAEFFNALNHTNLGTPNATVFSGSQVNASAGLITNTATYPRQIQFGVKLSF
jgi:hypothetical protein